MRMSAKASSKRLSGALERCACAPHSSVMSCQIIPAHPARPGRRVSLQHLPVALGRSRLKCARASARMGRRGAHRQSLGTDVQSNARPMSACAPAARIARGLQRQAEQEPRREMSMVERVERWLSRLSRQQKPKGRISLKLRLIQPFFHFPSKLA